MPSTAKVMAPSSVTAASKLDEASLAPHDDIKVSDVPMLRMQGMGHVTDTTHEICTVEHDVALPTLPDGPEALFHFSDTEACMRFIFGPSYQGTFTDGGSAAFTKDDKDAPTAGVLGKDEKEDGKIHDNNVHEEVNNIQALDQESARGKSHLEIPLPRSGELQFEFGKYGSPFLCHVLDEVDGTADAYRSRSYYDQAFGELNGLDEDPDYNPELERCPGFTYKDFRYHPANLL